MLQLEGMDGMIAQKSVNNGVSVDACELIKHMGEENVAVFAVKTNNVALLDYVHKHFGLTLNKTERSLLHFAVMYDALDE